MNQTIRMTTEEFRESPMYSGFQTGQAKRTGRPSARPAIPPRLLVDTEQPIEDGETIIIDLPFAPSVNEYWERAKNGHVYIGKRGLVFRQKVVELIARQELRGKCGKALVDVALILHPPNNHIHDCDNYCKALFDALTKARFWVDDSQVKLNVVMMGKVLKKGRIEMAVRLHREMPMGAAELLARV